MTATLTENLTEPKLETYNLKAIDALLYRALDSKASDLHITAGEVPWVSVHGSTQHLPGVLPVMTADMIAGMFMEMVSPEQWANYRATKRLDFSHATPRSRFRAHFAIAGGKPMGVFREIPNTVPDFKDLGLPDKVGDLIDLEGGIVFFCGVTGSGKSSSLAALIKLMKTRHARKIITIENPIEFKHTSDRSLIVQREVGLGADVDSFSLGIEDAMREAPDVILVGEMRDPETMSAAISAASSGHLVFSTIHAESTADVPTRILDSMPEGRVNDVRAQLSRSLKAVVYQKLLPKVGGEGRAVATEVLINNPAIANMIRQNDLEGIQGQLNSVKSGCIPFEVSLVNLVLDNVVRESTAERAEIRPGSFERQKKVGRRAY
jgi:twitching motility protein PilT